MHVFDTISARLLPIPNIDVIKIKDLYTLNTQVLKKIELPEHKKTSFKVRERKRFFPEVLSTCIYDQIAAYLKEEQMHCIKAIEKSDHMFYVDTKTETDTEKDLR
jgi:hypothetical protein